jgi:hypothetical protein
MYQRPSDECASGLLTVRVPLLHCNLPQERLVKHFITILGTVTAALIQGCSEQGSTAPAESIPGIAHRAVALEFDPANFVATIDNPYFPLIPGTVFHYRSETSDGVETGEVEVTHATKQILGVTTTVVHDRVSLDGELTEDTFDWFAQDQQGNVWYFGEDSKEIEDGQVVSTEGSWQAGVNGAEPGIVMLAELKSGTSYRQELAPDVAEDMARVLGRKASVSVPYGDFEGCLHTLEWTPLEPGVREHKFYCPGVGLVLEVAPREGHGRNELIAITD